MSDPVSSPTIDGVNATGTDWLEASARSHPDRIAVVDAFGQLTFSELLARVQAFATVLGDVGVGSGDLVAVDLPAGGGAAIAIHGAILAGAVVQPLPKGGPEGVGLPADATIADAELLAAAAEIPAGFGAPRRGLAAPLTRLLTSGTSGEPKGVELTAGNHLASALASALNLGTEPQDRWLCCLPLNHVGGLTILIRSAIYSTAVAIEEGFEVDRVAALLESGDVTIASLVPTQLVRLLDAGAAIERPRLLLVGGGPLPIDVLGEALDRGATVVQTYGLTEACSQVCTLAPEEAHERAGSAGRPLSGTEVEIDDGEILVRGPTVAPGSAASDGWLHTGDVGRIDGDGYLWVEGRRDDLIVSGGENVSPERVEASLRKHPAVADAGVVGMEDREWGQAVVAFVVPGPGAEPDREALLAHARSMLARHEVPKRVELVEELPRTESGKLVRRHLREIVR